MTSPLIYCPTCGTNLISKQIEGRIRRYCQHCGKPIYRNPKPCSGVLVVDERERLLLVKRTQPPSPGAWSVPAGYLEADEPPRKAAIRELHEETGLTVSIDDIQLFDTMFVRHPGGQHVLVIIYITDRSATSGNVIAGSDAAEAQFWNLMELQTSGEQIEPGYAPLFEQALENAHRLTDR